jgi:hypothetical protein
VPANYGLQRQRKPPPTRAKLEDVDDDFLRTDYFEVDSSVLTRGKEEKETSTKKTPARGRRGRGGRKRRKPGASTSKEGEAPSGARAGREKAARKTDQEAASGPESSEGAAKTKRRRRRRRPSGSKTNTSTDAQ